MWHVESAALVEVTEPPWLGMMSTSPRLAHLRPQRAINFLNWLGGFDELISTQLLVLCKRCAEPTFVGGWLTEKGLAERGRRAPDGSGGGPEPRDGRVSPGQQLVELALGGPPTMREITSVR